MRNFGKYNLHALMYIPFDYFLPTSNETNSLRTAEVYLYKWDGRPIVDIATIIFAILGI